MMFVLGLVLGFPGVCATAACWEASAEQAAALGNSDVAAGRRGEAFRCEPTPVRLGRWIDGLLAGGEVRRAHAGLAEARGLAERRGDAALKAAVSGVTVPAVRDGPVSPGIVGTEVRAAYVAMHARRWDRAAKGFAGVSEPYHLAHRAEVQARRGEDVAARRAWAAARAGFHDVGARTRLVVPGRWETTAVAWHGDVLAELQAADFGEFERVSRVRLRGRTGELKRSMLLGFAPVLAFNGDAVLRGGSAVFEHDVVTGAVRVHARAAGEWRSLLALGTGDNLAVLIHGSAAVELWAAGGAEPVGRWTEDADRVEAAAISPDGKLVALGGLDSRVRVHDVVTGTTRVLELAWTRVATRVIDFARRGNPVVALRFDRARRLIAVHAQGEISVWDGARGALLSRHEGACTAAEARVRSDYAVEVKEQREMCGRAEVASVASDGETVAVGGYGLVRVRATSSGKTLRSGMFGPRWAPVRAVALTDAGAVAVVDRDGATTLWSAGGARRRLAAGKRSNAEPDADAMARPRNPAERRSVNMDGAELVGDGRVLRSRLGDEVRLWDIGAGRRMSVTRGGEVLQALSADGRFAAVEVSDGLQVREVASGEVVYRRTWARHEGLYSVHVANRGHALVSFYSKSGRHEGGVELASPDGRVAKFRISSPAGLSDDGRWLVNRSVGFSGKDDMSVSWYVSRPGSKPVHRHSLRSKTGRGGLGPAERVVFTRDAERIAWSVGGSGGSTVGTRRLVGEPVDRSYNFAGKLIDLAFSADGSEVLMLGESGRFVRWDWETSDTREHADASGTTVTASADGQVLWFGRHDRVEIRRNDDALTRLAEVRPLSDGGWVVISAAGAVDGSARARDELLTVVQGSDATLVFGGALGWDGAYVGGTLARALGGELVRPPVSDSTEGP